MRRLSFIELMIVLAIVGIPVAAAWSVLEDGKRPNMTLKKDDWQCTKYETSTYLQQIGTALMPMTTTKCIEYQRASG